MKKNTGNIQGKAVLDEAEWCRFCRDLAKEMRAKGYTAFGNVALTYEDLRVHPQTPNTILKILRDKARERGEDPEQIRPQELTVATWIEWFLSDCLNLTALKKIWNDCLTGRPFEEVVTVDSCEDLLVHWEGCSEESLQNRTRTNAEALCDALKKVLLNQKVDSKVQKLGTTQEKLLLSGIKTKELFEAGKSENNKRRQKEAREKHDRWQQLADQVWAQRPDWGALKVAEKIAGQDESPDYIRQLIKKRSQTITHLKTKNR